MAYFEEIGYANATEVQKQTLSLA